MHNPIPTRKAKLTILGTMSGTSCDGLDLCLAQFGFQNGTWTHSILHGITIPYPKFLENQLRDCAKLKADKLFALDVELGKFMGDSIVHWLNSISAPAVDYIGHHGHTVFHQPHNGFSVQIGSSDWIAKKTQIVTIGDFRKTDILQGGQGAPLVPVGDDLLFGHYSHRLNLGGFSNISFSENGILTAGDITAANLLLNHFSRKKGLPYDDEGKMGRTGVIHSRLLEQWNQLPILQKPFPRSFGIEEFNTYFLPLIPENLSPEDGMRTAVEHIALQVGRFSSPMKRGLMTGGGAYNAFLVERIQVHAGNNYTLPQPETIEYKEALLFGFLAALFIYEQPSTFPGTTGCVQPTINGRRYDPFPH